jgi:hypothetical protein
MNWEALGAIGEIVGAVAVVVTLGYLAVQIRQNTRVVTSATHHSTASMGIELDTMLVQSPDVAKVMLTGLRQFGELKGEERFRFDSMMRASFSYYEDMFFQHQQATITPEFWSSREAGFLVLLRWPGVVSWWSQNRQLWSNSFAAKVDDLLAALQAAGE